MEMGRAGEIGVGWMCFFFRLALSIVLNGYLHLNNVS